MNPAQRWCGERMASRRAGRWRVMRGWAAPPHCGLPQLSLTLTSIESAPGVPLTLMVMPLHLPLAEPSGRFKGGLLVLPAWRVLPLGYRSPVSPRLP